MAFVADRIKGTILVGGKDDSVVPINLDMTATTLATALLDLGNVIEALDDVSDGHVLGYTLSQRYVQTTYIRPTSMAAEGGEKATLVIGIEGNPFKSATLSIPFPKDEIFLTTYGEGRNIVDVENLAVGIWTAKYGAMGESYVSDGEHGDIIRRGYRS
jgi:hypothetical protein